MSKPQIPRINIYSDHLQGSSHKFSAGDDRTGNVHSNESFQALSQPPILKCYQGGECLSHLDIGVLFCTPALLAEMKHLFVSVRLAWNEAVDVIAMAPWRASLMGASDSSAVWPNGFNQGTKMRKNLVR